ncbi:MAG: hypothetical protein V4547_18790 [Bacteroidota bacterium]
MKKETKRQIAEREYREYCLTCIMIFMGGHFNPEKRIYAIEGRQRQGDPDYRGYYLIDSLKYATLWDGWLKDVVLKIMSLDESIFNYDAPKMSWVRQVKIMMNSLPITTPHEEIYKMVVNFCSWFNQNKPLVKEPVPA